MLQSHFTDRISREGGNRSCHPFIENINNQTFIDLALVFTHQQVGSHEVEVESIDQSFYLRLFYIFLNKVGGGIDQQFHVFEVLQDFANERLGLIQFS